MIHQPLDRPLFGVKLLHFQLLKLTQVFLIFFVSPRPFVDKGKESEIHFFHTLPLPVLKSTQVKGETS